MRSIKLPLACAVILTSLAGCLATSGSSESNTAADKPYGTNNTLDPADITGSGSAGNVTGLPGFARGSSHKDD